MWSEIDGGRLSELGRNELFRRHTLGFQKVRTYDKQNEKKPCRAKVKGYLDDWYPAELEGSDPKSIEEIGRGKKCYLKLSELSFEAVKFALTEPRERVSLDLHKHTSSYIHSICFEGGVLDGETLYFSPELNTLIGVRGSGKSSILEAIRYALDIPPGDKALDRKYKEALVKHTLGSGGKVTLRAYDIYGQEFVISRILNEAPNVYVDGKLQRGVSIRETVLRHPIYFGQKDLSSTGDGFETDLVEKLVGDKLRFLRDDIERQRQLVQETAQHWLKLDNALELKKEYESELSDANFRLKKFEEYGIGEKLQKRISFQQDANMLNRAQGRVDNFIYAFDQLITDHEDELRNTISYVSKENEAFFRSYYVEFSNIIEKFEQLKELEEDIRKIATNLRLKRDEFEGTRVGLQEEFAQVERQLAHELQQSGVVTINPDDFIKQQQRKQKAQQMLEALNKQEGQQELAKNALFEEIGKLNEMRRKEFSEIKQELDHVNANHKSLQIEAEFKGDKESAIVYMQQLFKGSNIRESTIRSVMEDYADFGALLRDLPNALKKAGSTPEVFKNTFIMHLVDLVSWKVPNRFKICYRGKELTHHSLGQRASALLLYVLSQHQNDVIIIDQPEDDLDNQTIYDDVIKLLLEMKLQCQFIFATHNANFPVLGGAEQVIACRYHDETVLTESGGIDACSIQNDIINIMEGGKEAFNRRKEVYNLWKSQS